MTGGHRLSKSKDGSQDATISSKSCPCYRGVANDAQAAESHLAIEMGGCRN